MSKNWQQIGFVCSRLQEASDKACKASKDDMLRTGRDMVGQHESGKRRVSINHRVEVASLQVCNTQSYDAYWQFEVIKSALDELTKRIKKEGNKDFFVRLKQERLGDNKSYWAIATNDAELLSSCFEWVILRASAIAKTDVLTAPQLKSVIGYATDQLKAKITKQKNELTEQGYRMDMEFGFDMMASDLLPTGSAHNPLLTDRIIDVINKAFNQHGFSHYDNSAKSYAELVKGPGVTITLKTNALEVLCSEFDFIAAYAARVAGKSGEGPGTSTGGKAH